MSIIVLTGSARPNSAGNHVYPVVEGVATSLGLEVEHVDVTSLDLPFFNAPMPPSAEGYQPEDERVVAWTNKVNDADGVVLITPEYNGGPSAIQKNAIDWIYSEWNEKPVVMIGYGWHLPSRVHESLAIALTQVKASQGRHEQLQFGVELEMDGTVKDQAAVDAKVRSAIESLSIGKE